MRSLSRDFIGHIWQNQNNNNNNNDFTKLIQKSFIKQITITTATNNPRGSKRTDFQICHTILFKMFTFYPKF